MVSLGFRDLNEDEALLVAIYRDWARQDDLQGTVETVVAEALSQDALHKALGAVFAVFRQSTPDAADPCGAGDLLSDHEERLLDALSEMARTACPRSDEGAVLRLLRAVRPAGEIHRSGQDELIHKASMGAWTATFSS